jgi:hypothetical protein
MRFTGEEGDEEGISSIFTAGSVSPLVKWIELYPVMHCFLEISLPPKRVDSQDAVRSSGHLIEPLKDCHRNACFLAKMCVTISIDHLQDKCSSLALDRPKIGCEVKRVM